MVIIRGSMPLITETLQQVESVPETEIHSLFHPTRFRAARESHAILPGALVDRLEYELTFNDYNFMIQAAGDDDASYHIGGYLLSMTWSHTPNWLN